VGGGVGGRMTFGEPGALRREEAYIFVVNSISVSGTGAALFTSALELEGNGNGIC